MRFAHHHRRRPQPDLHVLDASVSTQGTAGFLAPKASDEKLYERLGVLDEAVRRDGVESGRDIHLIDQTLLCCTMGAESRRMARVQI